MRLVGWQVLSVLCAVCLLATCATTVYAPTADRTEVQAAVWTPKPIWRNTATSVPPTVTATSTAPPTETPIPTPAGPPVLPDQATTVESLLAGMTLEQKVGQVMMPVVSDSPVLTEDMRRRVAEMHLGGVVLREKNVGVPAALVGLINDLQAVARDSGSPGLLVGMDQEGGQVSRLRLARGYTEFPSPMALAATPDGCTNARAVAEAIAAEMRALGINTDLAPVLDVNNNPENPVIGVRSFSSDPYVVTECGIAAIQGFAAQGIIAVAKHFPGHGDTAVDSHTGLPVVTHPRDHLELIEFAPFRAAVAAGVPAIMSAHIVYPALDDTPNLPVTLSPRVLTGLLREEWGFDGAIFSDAMTMGALAAANYPTPRAAVAAVSAGVDVLLFGEGAQIQRTTYTELLAAVQDGRITAERLDDAVRRVLTLKAQYGLLNPAPVDPAVAASQVGTPEHRELARRISAESVTLVKDNAGLLPLKPGTLLLLIENDYTVSANVDIEIEADRQRVSLEPTQGEIERALAASEGRLVIVTTANMHKNPERPALVRALLAAGRQVIVIALAAPYDLLYFPDVPTYLAIYGVAPDTMRALTEVLQGRQEPVGRLPVDLQGLYPLGYRWPHSVTGEMN